MVLTTWPILVQCHISIPPENVTSFALKELRNCILCVKCGRSFFCSSRIYLSLHFLHILSEDEFFLSLCILFVFCLFCVLNWKKQSLEVFYKKAACKDFAKFTGKHLCQSLKSATLLKKRCWQRCFPLNFTKFLRKHFLQNTFRWHYQINNIYEK